VLQDFSLVDNALFFDEPVEDVKEVVISHSKNSFIIDFIALHYKDPKNNQYAYMLNGFDESWNYCSAGESFTKYTNVPSGEYTFRVIAANSDGVWNFEGASLKIIIEPPIWREWWFN
jgi:hypothetical protein